MKQASTILLFSSLLYFVAGAFWRMAGEVTIFVDLLNIVALLLLCWGAIKWSRERRARKHTQIKRP